MASRTRDHGRIGHVVAAVAGAFLLHGANGASVHLLARISVASGGTQGNAPSGGAWPSADATLIAFASGASNLTAGDTNGVWDVFVHDALALQTSRVSVSSAGAQGNGDSGEMCMSDDARFVAFTSAATNLVPNDTNDKSDVFVHDRDTGQTARVSVSSAGVQAGGDSRFPRISADGRFVVFMSSASNLVPGDTNGQEDVFVHDRQTGDTTRVNVSSAGAQAVGGRSFTGGISGDGRLVVFVSETANLVPGDANGLDDVFLHDRATGATSLVSLSTSGAQGNNLSVHATISRDGQVVAFASYASNFVTGGNSGLHIYTRDLATGVTELVDRTTAGGVPTQESSPDASLSADGRFVAFHSTASNLVPHDTNGRDDVFIRDRATGQVARASLTIVGAQGNSHSGFGVLTPDGGAIVFQSGATNMIGGDTNGVNDSFLRLDPFEQVCVGDVNADGVVNFSDLAIVLANFAAIGVNLPGDIDRDGMVTFLDLNFILSYFGTTC